MKGIYTDQNLVEVTKDMNQPTKENTMNDDDKPMWSPEEVIAVLEYKLPQPRITVSEEEIWASLEEMGNI